MSRNINKLAQDTALIVVQTDASEFGIYVKRTTLVSVVSTGLLAILMENGTAVDSLDTTLHQYTSVFKYECCNSFDWTKWYYSYTITKSYH